MFHVEHTPIEILATLFWGAFEQTETVRVNQLQREQLGELRSTASALPVNAYLVIGLAITRNAEFRGNALNGLQLGKDRATVLLVLNNGL